MDDTQPARAPTRSSTYDDEWWLALLAGVLVSLVNVVAMLRDSIERSMLGREREQNRMPIAVDAGLDLTLRAAGIAAKTTRKMLDAARPLSNALLRPPLVPHRYQPQARLAALAQRGHDIRTQVGPRTAQLVSDLVPVALNAVLDRIDLTALVLERLELEQVIDAADVNEVAARLQLMPIVDRLPIDHIIDNVDINRVVAQVDLDAIVERIDIDAIAARVDVGAVVGRLDLASLANQVIDAVDLPGIIRESSGAMASDTVLSLRMQGIEADEWVSRVVDKVRVRRRDRGTDVDPNGNEIRHDGPR